MRSPSLCCLPDFDSEEKGCRCSCSCMHDWWPTQYSALGASNGASWTASVEAASLLPALSFARNLENNFTRSFGTGLSLGEKFSWFSLFCEGKSETITRCETFLTFVSGVRNKIQSLAGAKQTRWVWSGHSYSLPARFRTPCVCNDAPGTHKDCWIQKATLYTKRFIRVVISPVNVSQCRH